MNLAGSASGETTPHRSSGYAMAALLITLSVMAVLLTVALPTWRQTIQREKEEELIFRGTQYSRAIAAYQRKYANASPPTLDVLVEQHYLRQKFKDPLAISQDGEFDLLHVKTQGIADGAAASTTGTPAGTSQSGGPIIGVASKNPGQSIREYNGHTHYNEWQFIPLQQTTRGGGPPGGGGSQNPRTTTGQPQGRDGLPTRGRDGSPTRGR